MLLSVANEACLTKRAIQSHQSLWEQRCQNAVFKGSNLYRKWWSCRNCQAGRTRIAVI